MRVSIDVKSLHATKVTSSVFPRQAEMRNQGLVTHSSVDEAMFKTRRNALLSSNH